MRQLIYDFKPWRRLEATGRAGSDDGFDARGYEMLAPEASTEAALTLAAPEAGGVEAVESEAAIVAGQDDRLWLVQCKRERTIGPKKLLGYVDDIVLADGENLYGIVLVAACDFSKTARDRFAAKCRERGIEEWHLWGKAELEDRLFLPQNDHLLFAYFGISLAIRRRSQRTEIRAKLAMKRKAARLLKNHEHDYLLLRPAQTPTYPHAVGVRDPVTGQTPWLVRRYIQLWFDGLLFCVRKYFAYLHEDGEQWDAATVFNDASPTSHDDPWLRKESDHELRMRIHDAWSALPKANQAWLEVLAVIRYEDILDIDELGDEHFSNPHIYAAFGDRRQGPFTDFYVRVETVGGYGSRVLWVPDRDVGRISVFPDELRGEEPVT